MGVLGPTAVEYSLLTLTAVHNVSGETTFRAERRDRLENTGA